MTKIAIGRPRSVPRPTGNGPDAGFTTWHFCQLHFRNFLKSTGRFSTNAFRPSIASSVR
jgi:hypothetical protein